MRVGGGTSERRWTALGDHMRICTRRPMRTLYHRLRLFARKVTSAVSLEKHKSALSSDMSVSARRMKCGSSEMSKEGPSKNVILAEWSKGASTCAPGTSEYMLVL